MLATTTTVDSVLELVLQVAGIGTASLSSGNTVLVGCRFVFSRHGLCICLAHPPASRAPLDLKCRGHSTSNEGTYTSRGVQRICLAIRDCTVELFEN